MTVSLTLVLQVKEAYPLLNQLRDRDLKGELSSLQRGKYKRLLGECLRADPALSLAQDYVLTLAQAAYRLHFSLFSRIDTEHSECGVTVGSVWGTVSTSSFSPASTPSSVSVRSRSGLFGVQSPQFLCLKMIRNERRCVFLSVLRADFCVSHNSYA